MDYKARQPKAGMTTFTEDRVAEMMTSFHTHSYAVCKGKLQIQLWEAVTYKQQFAMPTGL